MNTFVVIYLTIYFLFFAFLIDLLPFGGIVKSIIFLSKTSYQTIRSDNIEDDMKEGILLRNSWSMFLQSLKIMSLIAIVIIEGLIVLLTSLLFKQLKYHLLVEYIFTVNGFWISIISFFLYYLLKKLYVKVRL